MPRPNHNLDAAHLNAMRLESAAETRALLVRCPVSWCRAAVGEPCVDEHDEYDVAPHAPRRALLPNTGSGLIENDGEPEAVGQ